MVCNGRNDAAPADMSAPFIIRSLSHTKSKVLQLPVSYYYLLLRVSDSSGHPVGSVTVYRLPIRLPAKSALTFR